MRYNMSFLSKYLSIGCTILFNLASFNVKADFFLNKKKLPIVHKSVFMISIA